MLNIKKNAIFLLLLTAASVAWAAAPTVPRYPDGTVRMDRSPGEKD